MKKFCKTLGLLIAGILSAAGLAGCNSGPEGNVIRINVPNGGYGITWMEETIADWEAENEGWTIEMANRKTPISTFTTDVETGNDINIFYAAGVEYQDGIYKGLFEDMSDILDRKVDGEDGLTIGEKIMDFDAWKKAGSKNGEGFYIIPWADAISGFVYDHDLFVTNGWLYFADANDDAVVAELQEQKIQYEKVGNRCKFVSAEGSVNYEAGDWILSAGKDDTYGTYDDGQPETLAQFDELVRNLAVGGYPFLWAGGYDDYTTPVFSSIFANYEGEENFRTFFDYSGKYTFGNEPEVTITEENGYLVYQMEGIRKAMEFMNTYLNNPEYVHPSSLLETSHRDAQGLFLTGYKGSAQNLQAGFLCESTWWENEARGSFNSISSDEGRGYGEREYRYMLFPEIPGQKGIDGKGNGTIYTAYDTCGFVVVKKDDPVLMEKVKDFCAFSLKDKYLRRFTTLTGTKRPYLYELTEEDYAQMTPFARNAVQLYDDKENIKILRPKLLNLSTPVSYGSSKGTASMWQCTVDNVSFGSPINALYAANGKSDPVATCMDGFKQYYTQSKWQRYLEEYKAFMQG